MNWWWHRVGVAQADGLASCRVDHPDEVIPVAVIGGRADRAGMSNLDVGNLNLPDRSVRIILPGQILASPVIFHQCIAESHALHAHDATRLSILPLLKKMPEIDPRRAGGEDILYRLKGLVAGQRWR